VRVLCARTHAYRQYFLLMSFHPHMIESLFLASTVNALHRNAHIWNASHPLLVTYYCGVTAYPPGTEAKKIMLKREMTTSGMRTRVGWNQSPRIGMLCYSNIHTQWVVRYKLRNANDFKLQITKNGRIQLTPKITNHVFTCYLNCMCKSNPICLIQQWSVIILLGSYVR